MPSFDTMKMLGCYTTVLLLEELLRFHTCYSQTTHIFLFRANGTEANVMKRILNKYEEVSGQMVNYSKSTIIFSPNTNEGNRRDVCAQLEVSEVKGPGKYLGIPMYIGRDKCATFRFLLERIEHNLPGWRQQTISKAGKLRFLKQQHRSFQIFG